MKRGLLNWLFKIFIYVALFTSLHLKLYAQSTALLQNIYSRSITSLNGRWNYIIDPYETGYYDYRHKAYDESESGKGGFYDDRKANGKTDLVEYSFNNSPTLKVPGDWNSQVDKLEMYEGTIWLRRLFSINLQNEKRYFLYFGAVNYKTNVYLNGKKLGIHKGGFTPFQFDVTDALFNGENVLIVKADNTRGKDEIPTVNTDWWNYGGITRDVLLAEVSTSYIKDYKVQLAKSNLKIIEGFVQLGGEHISQKVSITIPEAGIKKQFITDTNGTVQFSLPIKKIDYWTPEAPRLYDVVIECVTDTVLDKIGFRTIETKGQNILLNGKSVFLRGISMHDENPLIPGRLRGNADMRMLLHWAKEMNCNYVRLAHYPHSEEMVRLADEMGLLVWAEVPVYWTISWLNEATYLNAEKQLSELIIRDKNRASVIVWSVGNETPISNARNIFMEKLVTKARYLDNTRLVAAALEIHRKDSSIIVDDPLGEKLDLISFNEYAGWYWSNTKAMLSYKFNITYNKPVVITEFGADALGGYYADDETRWSEEYQELLYKNQFKMLSAIDGLRGMTPWILVDFKSPRRQHPYFQDNWNRKGLISETGKYKKAFYTLKSFYNDIQTKYN